MLDKTLGVIAAQLDRSVVVVDDASNPPILSQIVAHVTPGKSGVGIQEGLISIWGTHMLNGPKIHCLVVLSGVVDLPARRFYPHWEFVAQLLKTAQF